MEIKEFIKSVLKDISEAIEESTNDKHTFSITFSLEEKKGIDFDLAVVLKKDATGKIGAEIFTIIGAKAEGSISEENVNRIKFTVMPYKK